MSHVFWDSLQINHITQVNTDSGKHTANCTASLSSSDVIKDIILQGRFFVFYNRNHTFMQNISEKIIYIFESEVMKIIYKEKI